MSNKLKPEDKALYVKTIILSMMLVETFDVLEELNNYKYLVKNLGKRYNVELEKLINAVYNGLEEKSKNTDYINDVIEKINCIFDREDKIIELNETKTKQNGETKN